MIYRWTDVDTLPPVLFGRPVEPLRTISSADGVACLFELDADSGAGYVEHFQFADGLSMVVFNCSWRESRTFEVEDEGRSRMSFTLDLNMTLDVGSAVIDANTPAWRLMNNAAGVVTQETVSAGSKTVWVTVAFLENYLDRFLSLPDGTGKPRQLDVFKTNPEKSIVRIYPLDHHLNLITSNIISLNAHDAVYVSLARAKASELICNALDRMLNRAGSKDDLPVRLRQKDREAIKLARDILITNLAEPPSIRELCAAVGVNRNKLHYGFKEEFGLTPSQILEEQRLDRAYDRLRNTDELIYRIAADVGYGTQSSFSTAFKRKYGVSPKEARSAHRPSV